MLKFVKSNSILVGFINFLFSCTILFCFIFPCYSVCYGDIVDSIYTALEDNNYCKNKSEYNPVIKNLEDLRLKLIATCSIKDNKYGYLNGRLLDRIVAFSIARDSGCTVLTHKCFEVEHFRNDKAAISDTLRNAASSLESKVAIIKILAYDMIRSVNNSRCVDSSLIELGDLFCGIAGDKKIRKLIDSLHLMNITSSGDTIIDTSSFNLLRSFSGKIAQDVAVRNKFITLLDSSSDTSAFDLMIIIYNAIQQKGRGQAEEFVKTLGQEQLLDLYNAVNATLRRNINKYSYLKQLIEGFPLEKITEGRAETYRRLAIDIENYGVISETLQRLISQYNDSLVLGMKLQELEKKCNAIMDSLPSKIAIENLGDLVRKQGHEAIFCGKIELLPKGEEVKTLSPEAKGKICDYLRTTLNDAFGPPRGTDTTPHAVLGGVYQFGDAACNGKRNVNLSLWIRMGSAKGHPLVSTESICIDPNAKVISSLIIDHVQKLLNEFKNIIAMSKIFSELKDEGLDHDITQVVAACAAGFSASTDADLGFDAGQYSRFDTITIGVFKKKIDLKLFTPIDLSWRTELFDGLRDMFGSKIIVVDNQIVRNSLRVEGTYDLVDSGKIVFFFEFPDTQNIGKYKPVEVLTIHIDKSKKIGDKIAWSRAVEFACNSLQARLGKRCEARNKIKTVIQKVDTCKIVLPHTLYGYYLPLAFAPAGTPHLLLALWPKTKTIHRWRYGLYGLSLAGCQVGGGLLWYFKLSKFDKYNNDNTVFMKQSQYNNRFLLGGFYGGYVGMLQGLSVVTLAHLDRKDYKEKRESTFSISPVLNLSKKESGIMISLGL